MASKKNLPLDRVTSFRNAPKKIIKLKIHLSYSNLYKPKYLCHICNLIQFKKLFFLVISFFANTKKTIQFGPKNWTFELRKHLNNGLLLVPNLSHDLNHKLLVCYSSHDLNNMLKFLIQAKT